MESELADDLVELLIASRIQAGTWQTVALGYAPDQIPVHILEAARKQYELALQPAWNEYKKQRQSGNSPEAAWRLAQAKFPRR